VREIQRLTIDKATGDATLTTEIADGEADTAERFRQLKASLPEIEPGAVTAAAVRCDGCGDAAEVDFGEPQLPPGWTATPGGDSCPRCRISN